MTRLAGERTTHLTPQEIAAEALRQFDAGPNEPSLRSLAAALGVVPAAIYHHFSSQAAIWQAAVEMVWDEALLELLRLVPDPFDADPVETLVAVGIATRRAWLSHHRLSRHMAATPGGTQFRSDAVSLMSGLFERLGLTSEQAGLAFHSYASFMVGAVLYAAANRTANEQLANGDPTDRFASVPEPAWSEQSNAETRRSLVSMAELSVVDPARDEELFVYGMQRLVEGLAATRD